jgi:ribosomal protein L37AE/L43A
MSDKSGRIYKNNCPSCGVEKVNRKRDVGKMCRKCNASITGKYKRQKNNLPREEYLKRLKERMKNDVDWRLKKMLNGTRGRAKAKGLEFDLTMEDVYAMYPKDGLCPVLGIELRFDLGRKHVPSLDRFDNNRGYTKDNTYLISMRANILKSDASFDEIERIYYYMKYGTA